MNLNALIHLKPEEEILQVVRESVIPHLWKFFLLIVWFLVPFFFLFPLFQAGVLGITAFCVLCVSALILFWRAYRKWVFTMLVITDLRLIDVDQRGMFDRIVTETMYPEIEDVRYRQKGIRAMLFRYGTLKLKMPVTGTDLIFRYVHDPSQVHDLINDLRAEHA